MDTTLQDPLVGRVLDERYRVESRLAVGGMATVYLALDMRLDRTVALKVMHPGLAVDEEFVCRFIREAKSAARLSHPNVVSVFDQGADSGVLFLAMEYVEGRTLRDQLRECGRLTPRAALETVEAVLAALSAAHRAGLVHRDIKPENVLLADDGRIKVADFGLARAVTTTTSASTGVLLGTVSYLAPEQIERGVSDPRSDVYATGIMLFELLTGRKPHQGESPIEVVYKHVHTDVPAPSSVVPGIPHQLDELVYVATSRDPDGRPADAGRMLALARRVHHSLTDAELDTVPAGPAGQQSAGTDNTVAVARAARAAARRNDTSADTRRTADTSGTTTGPDENDIPSRSPRGPFAIAVILLLAILAGVGTWWFAIGRFTATPSLINMSQAEAETKARASGLRVRLGKPGFSEVITSGHVMTTQPKPGGRITRGGTVTLVLSTGPERHVVPNLVGQPLPAALRLLSDNALAEGETTEQYNESVPAGAVIASDPPAGQETRRDHAVNLVLSKGPPPIAVPDVVGRPLDEAISALQTAGFDPEVSPAQEHSDSVLKGAVAAQSPANGKAPKGSVIVLTVSKGPQILTVPNVVGMSLDAARSQLTAAGFSRVETVALPVGPSEVRSQSPGGGMQVPRATTITLYVY